MEMPNRKLEKKHEKVEFRSDPTIKEYIRKAAADEHRSESDMAREAVRRYFEGEPRRLVVLEVSANQMDTDEVWGKVNTVLGNRGKILRLLNGISDKDKYLESLEAFTEEWIERKDNFIKQAVESAEKPRKSSTGKRK